MDDLISRQAVIDKLKREEKIFYSPAGLRYLIGAVRDLPSLQSEKSTTAEKSQLADLISRRDAIEVAKKHWYKPDIAGALAELPSAQPERKKGEWIDQDEGAFYPVECSECRKIPLFDVDGDYILSNFCPNCGAEMKE